jgi:hypothetical protein
MTLNALGYRYVNLFRDGVTEIILAKVSKLCQLSSHSRGFLSRQEF